MTGRTPFVTIRDGAAMLLLALALLLPALINRFPLIFPDTGAYLGIAFGAEYALDRSSLYGFLLKPIVTGVPTLAGLWLGVAMQCLLVAVPLWLVARLLTGQARAAAIVLALTILLTSLAWHAAQFMPDAFTGTTVLIAWLAARRDPAADGAPLLWLAALVAALMHYTHIPLLLVATAAALLAEHVLGVPWRDVGRRGAAALAVTAAALLIQIALNGAILGRAKLAPAGPLFIFARLNEDGLIAPWLADHCGRDAPPRLCTLAPALPRGSQQLLWAGAETPVTRLVWEAPPETRWRLVEEMAVANQGAILDHPLTFLRHAAAGAVRQFVSFETLDDECPANCRTVHGGVGQRLRDQRPDAFRAFTASRQYDDSLPKPLIRLVTGMAAALSLCAMPLVMAIAVRRRDRDALGLAGAILAALLVNAALAGALSDVHGRYQSRLVWLAPLLILLLAARWRRKKTSPLAARAAPTQSEASGAG